jgi:hypothetical protein
VIRRVLRVSMTMSVWIVSCFGCLSQDVKPLDQTTTTGCGLTSSERDELSAYRENVKKIIDDLKTCQAAQKTFKADDEYDKYLASFYDQAVSFRELRLKLYTWQLLAGNWILALVLSMSFGGFCITAFQIYQLYKLNRIETDTTIDISLRRIQLTTSITGVAVLAISFLFLIAFLHEVYLIRPLQDVSRSEPSTLKAE